MIEINDVQGGSTVSQLHSREQYFQIVFYGATDEPVAALIRSFCNLIVHRRAVIICKADWGNWASAKNSGYMRVSGGVIRSLDQKLHWMSRVA